MNFTKKRSAEPTGNQRIHIAQPKRSGAMYISQRAIKKSFGQAFSKACGVKGQSPCRPPQRSEYSLRFKPTASLPAVWKESNLPFRKVCAPSLFIVSWNLTKSLMSAMRASEKSVASDMHRAHSKPKIRVKFRAAFWADVKLIWNRFSYYEEDNSTEYCRRDRHDVPRHVVLLVKPIYTAGGKREGHYQ